MQINVEQWKGMTARAILQDRAEATIQVIPSTYGMDYVILLNQLAIMEVLKRQYDYKEAAK